MLKLRPNHAPSSRKSANRLWFPAIVAAALLAIPLASPPASAGPLAVVAGQALDVKADKLDVDIGAGQAVLEGSVHATLGELSVICPRVEIRYDGAPRVRWARGSGGVTASVRGIEAKADTVILDVTKRVVELSGGVRLSRGKGWVHAQRASIDLDTHKVSLQEVEGSIPVQPPAR